MVFLSPTGAPLPHTPKVGAEIEPPVIASSESSNIATPYPLRTPAAFTAPFATKVPPSICTFEEPLAYTAALLFDVESPSLTILRQQR